MYNFRKIIKDFIDSSESEKEIGNCNNFQRKLIYQLIYLNFRNEISASTRTLANNVKVILIEHKKTEEEYKLIEAQKKDNELAELKELIGFSAVLQKVSKSVGVQSSCLVIYFLFNVEFILEKTTSWT